MEDRHTLKSQGVGNRNILQLQGAGNKNNLHEKVNEKWFKKYVACEQA